MHYCQRDSHATSQTAIYANITQTGRIRVYCSCFWVVLVGFVGFVGGFGWFRVLVTTTIAGGRTKGANERVMKGDPNPISQ